MNSMERLSQIREVIFFVGNSMADHNDGVFSQSVRMTCLLRLRTSAQIKNLTALGDRFRHSAK